MKARTPAEINATTQYEHKGVKINFDIVRARFCADLKGVRLFAPSLDSMRKKIDEHQALKFEPFNILDYRYDKVDSMRVVGLQRSNYGGRDYVFLTDQGQERETVTPHTPANRKLVDAYQKIFTKNRAEQKRLEAEIDKARTAIPVLRAVDYRVKGAKS